MSAATDEYRHVRLTGRWLGHHDSWVQAVTVLGPGFWLIRPLQQQDGTVILVNCGFVRQAGSLGSAAGQREDTRIDVTGLLRLSEPGGGFLRHNDPAHGRWFSRDVSAIARAQDLAHVAPYFVDAEAPAAAGPVDPGADPQEPVPGLTVIQFPNNHLVYAFTWFTLAGMVGFAWRSFLRGADRRPDDPERQEHDGEHGRAG